MSTEQESFFATLLKEWTMANWPNLEVVRRHNSWHGEWVQISFDDGWTVVDIKPDIVTSRTIACYVSRNEPNDVWGDTKLNVADPTYFEKLNKIIKSSLVLTQESVQNKRRGNERETS